MHACMLSDRILTTQRLQFNSIERVVGKFCQHIDPVSFDRFPINHDTLSLSTRLTRTEYIRIFKSIFRENIHASAALFQAFEIHHRSFISCLFFINIPILPILSVPFLFTSPSHVLRFMLYISLSFNR